MDSAAAVGQATYRAIVGRKQLLVVAMAVGIALSIVVNVAVGSAGLSLGETMLSVLGRSTHVNQVVVWSIRVPMALSAVFIGAALGMAGCEIQTVLRNPMASPYTLGISASASFGAALAIVLDFSLVPGVGNFLVSVNAFVFTMAASGLILAFAMKRGADRGIIILFGIALSFLFGSMTTMLQYVADETDLQTLVFWSFGSLSKVTWPKLAIIVAVTTLCAALLARRAWTLTAMSLSDESARSLGVDVARTRRTVILLVALLSATSVSFAGTIGFVGLVAPHIARMVGGEEQRYFLPLSALTGALTLSVASILSKVIIKGTILPVGLITTFIGVPFFFALIVRRKRGYM